MSTLAQKADLVPFMLLTPVAGVKKPASIKVAVRNSGALVVNFNKRSFARFGAAVTHLIVRAGEADGAHFLQLQQGGAAAHKVVFGGKVAEDGSPSCMRVHVNDHPFEPGVTHGGRDVEASWDGGVVTLKMPDWDEILGEILEPAEDGE